MKKIIYLKEDDGKILYMEQCGETIKQAYITKFKINSKIVNLRIEKQRILTLLDSKTLIIVDNIEMLKNPVLKNLKNDIQTEIFVRVCISIAKKTKLSLNKVSQSKKLVVTSALAATFMLTSFSVSDRIESSATVFSDDVSIEQMESSQIDMTNSVAELKETSNKRFISDETSIGILENRMNFLNGNLYVVEENSEENSVEDILGEYFDQVYAEVSDSNVYQALDGIEIPETIEEKDLVQENETEEEIIIKKYADMYFIDYEVAKRFVEEELEEINEKETFELGVINCLKNHHWYDDTLNIDKTPIISEKTKEEKETIMLEFANIYGIYDEDTLATLIAINRWETGLGTSEVYINYNNCGGVMESGKFIRYKTFEIGAEAFVRTFLNIKNSVLEKASNYEYGFNPSYTLEGNMVGVYNGGPALEQESWLGGVKEQKSIILESEILKDYIDDDKVKTLKKSN